MSRWVWLRGDTHTLWAFNTDKIEDEEEKNNWKKHCVMLSPSINPSSVEWETKSKLQAYITCFSVILWWSRLCVQAIACIYAILAQIFWSCFCNDCSRFLWCLITSMKILIKGFKKKGSYNFYFIFAIFLWTCLYKYRLLAHIGALKIYI